MAMWFGQKHDENGNLIEYYTKGKRYRIVSGSQTWDIFYKDIYIGWQPTETTAKAFCQLVEDIGVEKFIHLPPKEKYEIHKKAQDRK